MDNEPSKIDKSNLDDLIYNNSFKIKPIFIELKNYSYYHAAISDNSDDYNKRFVGRSKLIKKIKTFVLESSKNTGTYLISGFRGMGKTSLVNKALSNLNPKSKFSSFALLWLFLIPLVFIDKEHFILKKSREILVFTAIIFILLLVFLRVQSSRLKSRKGFTREGFNSKVVKNFLYDFISPKLQREKYIFTKSLRLLVVYLLYFSFIVRFFYGQKIFTFESNHQKFWFLFFIIFFSYTIIDLIKEIIQYKDRKLYNFLLIVFFLIVFSSIPYFFNLITTVHYFYFLFFLITIILIFKTSFKLENIRDENTKYKTVFSRVLNFINLKQYIIVNINLSKDKLTEKDVLKYITNEISNEYKKWYYNFKSIKRIISILTLTLFLFFTINGLYDLIPNNYIFEQTNKTFEIAKYFPSQIFLDYDLEKDSLQKKQSKILKNNNYQDKIKELKKLDAYNNLKIGYESINTHHKLSNYTINKNDTVKTYNHSLITNAKFIIAKYTNLADFLFITTYTNVRNTVIGNPKESSFHGEILEVIFPKNPPLLVFLIFFSIFIIYRLLPLHLIPFNTHIAALRTLKELQNQIDASIVVENNSNASIGSKSLFNFKKSTSYQPLESKDISQRLIHILDKISNIKPFFTQINFILIFDELDKINSNYNASISNKEDEFNLEDDNKFHARRKERINKILSSMKFFLNTAKVKSIFIAGREMYDAALAGISDRESNLDSIFSDNKIYVNSFYTEADDGNLKDITSMTEQYVCQFIIPEYYKRKHRKEYNNPNLKMFNAFLEERNGENDSDFKNRILYIDELKRLNNKELDKRVEVFNNLIRINLKIDHINNTDTFKDIIQENLHIIESLSNEILLQREVINNLISNIILSKETKDFINKLLSETNYNYSNIELYKINIKKHPSLFIFSNKNLFVNIINLINLYFDIKNPSVNENNKKLITLIKNNVQFRHLSIKRQQRIKTISTLKDFIKYLTYRSNGAPRKLSNLFDQYVNAYTNKDLQEKGKLVYADNAESMCLKFSYYDQYKFSFVSYLITPIFLGLGHHMSDYSDKLLVSISYMLDHLFKHHKFGLSFRSLALTPEIIDVNKEPEFRDFLDKLIGFLSKSHLRKIVSGIYDYKFQGKIASELRFISKINELEAAAFNFTLDESVELKKHFHKKIKHLEEKYQNENFNITIDNTNLSENYINSISLIYIHLGDLHFNDEEYGEAIEYYLEALQTIRQKDIKDMQLYEFIVFVRNKLKLGLAFEKNKMFDNAEMTYSELTDLILNKRNIPIRKLGLARFVVHKNSRKYKSVILNNRLLFKKILESKGEQIKDHVNDDVFIRKVEETLLSTKTNIVEDIIFIGRPLTSFSRTFNEDDWKKIHDISKMDTCYGFNDEYFISRIDKFEINYKPLKRNYEFTTSENIRILYQPIIAKLHLIEKATPNRLKDIDLKRAIKEFNFYKRPLKTNEKRVIVAEFYNKIGDLLYFKNGTVNNILKQELLKNQTNHKILSFPIDSVVFYTKSLSILLIPYHQITESENIGKINVLSYYNFNDVTDYEDFFKNLLENILGIIKELEKIKNEKSYTKVHNSEYLTSVANGVIDLAGSLLSFASKKTELTHDTIKNLGEITISQCIQLFYHANLIYTKIGEHRLAKSQLIKIMHLLREMKEENETAVQKYLTGVNLDMEKITNTCIKYIYRTYDQSTRPEIKKLRQIFSLDNGFYPEIYKNTTIMAEISEIIHLYWLHKIKDKDWETLKEVKDIINYTYQNTTPYTYINKKYNRILELSLRIKVNKKLYNCYFDEYTETKFENYKEIYLYFKGIEYIKDDKDDKEILFNTLKSFLIIDSLGASNEVLKSHKLFDVNYITTSNLGLAKAHTNMGFWCEQYHNEKNEDLTKRVKRIINSVNLMYLSANYHYDLAQQFNYKVKNFHNKGIPLEDFLKNSSYLDDFYNDNLIHFSLAVERNNLYDILDKNNGKLKNSSKSNINVTNYKNYYY